MSRSSTAVSTAPSTAVSSRPRVVVPAAGAPVSSEMLLTFIELSHHLSVSATATALGCAKSVVSKRIALLESRLQTILFSRTTRKIVPTPAAEAYLPFARRALAEILGGEESLRAQRAELTGRIRLTAPVSWGQHVLSRRLPEFLRLHAGIEVELLLADRRLDLARERIDIALRWSSSASPELTSTLVASVGWVLAASAEYLARAGFPEQPGDLADHPCLCYWRETSDERWTLAENPAPGLGAPRRAVVQVHGRYHVDNPDAVAQAALAGLGIALLPDYLCQDALSAGRLVRVLPRWTPQTQFGTQILALATPERLRLQRNQVLWRFLEAGDRAA